MAVNLIPQIPVFRTEMASEHINDIKAIANRIKELRIKAGYTSYENFAVKNDLDRKQYWRMEEGQNFRIVSLLRITRIHGISLEEFFVGL